MKHPFCVFMIMLLLGCAPKSPPVPPTIAPPAAILDELIGTVLVDGIPATLGMELSPGMTITTGMTSRANVVLYQGAAVRITENTTITIGTLSKQSVRLSQLTGISWTKILRLAGIEEYTIQTPTTIATVRGTAFAVKVTEERTIIKVAEGTVEAVQNGQTMILEPAKLDEAAPAAAAFPADQELEQWVSDNLAEDKEFVKEAVASYAETYDVPVEKVAEEAGIAPEEITAAESVDETMTKTDIVGEPEPGYETKEPVETTISEKDMTIHDQETIDESPITTDEKPSTEEIQTAESPTTVKDTSTTESYETKPIYTRSYSG